MNQDYSTELGHLITNLHSVEFLLRTILFRKDEKEFDFEYLEIGRLKKGQKVPANPLTDYSTLLSLIKTYNKSVIDEVKVDERIVEIRDLIAHGRVICIDQSDQNCKIFKFSKVKDKHVTVTDFEVFNKKWITESRNFVHEQIVKLQRVFNK